MATQISEEQGIQKEWYEKAKEMQLEDLPGFINHLMEDYSHDYGTVCHAIAAGAIATAGAMNRHEKQGGITGFQAGAVMWQFLREWNFSGNKTGLRIIDYDDFLYPQYADKFQKTLSKSTWNTIQREAQKKVEEVHAARLQYIKDLEQYNLGIAKFVEKYPDYYENKKYYDRRVSGTSKEWEAEEKKAESGFEFAPEKPFEPMTNEHSVYLHWKAIVNGVVPFGYKVTDG